MIDLLACAAVAPLSASRFRLRWTGLVLLGALVMLGLPAVTDATCTPSLAPLDSPTALILSGGGAKGAFEAGVATTLIERGVPIRLVAGSSAGALNATMIADGRVERLAALWRTITREQVYQLRAPVLFGGLLPGWLTLLVLDRAGSLFDPQPLRDLITASVDLPRIRASPIRLLVTTSDLAAREKRLFDNQTVSVEALMAAAAVPGAFPPVMVAGSLLADGGLSGRAPVLEGLEAGVPVRRAMVVMSYAADERGAPPTTMRRTIEEAFEMGMIHQIRRDTELAKLKYPAVDVQLLTPSVPLLLRPLDFDPDVIARVIAQGHADATACLNAITRR